MHQHRCMREVQGNCMTSAPAVPCALCYCTHLPSREVLVALVCHPILFVGGDYCCPVGSPQAWRGQRPRAIQRRLPPFDSAARARARTLRLVCRGRAPVLAPVGAAVRASTDDWGPGAHYCRCPTLATQPSAPRDCAAAACARLSRLFGTFACLNRGVRRTRCPACRFQCVMDAAAYLLGLGAATRAHSVCSSPRADPKTFPVLPS